MSAKPISNLGDEFERAVTRIRREQLRLSFEAIDSLWRVGDTIRRLRRAVARGQWGTVIGDCAEELGLHASSLSDAARAASAFASAERRALRARAKESSVLLRPSHLIVLARVSPALRARGLETLLENALSVRELRRYLREVIL